MLQKISKRVLARFWQSVDEKLRISSWFISYTENIVSSADYDCLFLEDIFKMLLIKIKILVHLDICITRIPKNTKRTERDAYKFNFMAIR